MKRLCLMLVVLLNIASTGPDAPRRNDREPSGIDKKPVFNGTGSNQPVGKLTLYDQLNLSQFGLQRDVFDFALRGWQQIKTTKPVLSIVDLSQPSTRKRLYVVDLLRKRVLFNTYVSHGQKSGDLIPTSFSNVNSSFQTSLGFYKTLDTYMGKHGLSLQLKGLEKGFNDNVYNRNIVLHGADYACEAFIRKTGRLGRSQGCPAVPYAESKKIIQAVRGGTCLFVYSPNANYLTKSTYLAEPVASL